MKRRAPKATLDHEEIFTVAFAMFIAAANVSQAPRDELIWAAPYSSAPVP